MNTHCTCSVSSQCWLANQQWRKKKSKKTFIMTKKKLFDLRGGIDCCHCCLFLLFASHILLFLKAWREKISSNNDSWWIIQKMHDCLSLSDGSYILIFLFFRSWLKPSQNDCLSWFLFFFAIFFWIFNWQKCIHRKKWYKNPPQTSLHPIIFKRKKKSKNKI